MLQCPLHENNNLVFFYYLLMLTQLLSKPKTGLFNATAAFPSNSKAVSRENTDYDTFGSIDSLIFEPKIPTHEDIEEAQEEITQSFEYLENEDDGHVEMDLSEGPIKKMNILEKVSKFEASPGQVDG